MTISVCLKEPLAKKMKLCNVNVNGLLNVTRILFQILLFSIFLETQKQLFV